jgi:hypothetical protein
MWLKVVSNHKSLLKRERPPRLSVILPIFSHVRGPLSFGAISHWPLESTGYNNCHVEHKYSQHHSNIDTDTNRTMDADNPNRNRNRNGNGSEREHGNDDVLLEKHTSL